MTNIRASLTFQNSSADPIQDENHKVISKGAKGARLQLGDAKIALESTKIFSHPPSPTLKEKIFGKKYVILKIQDTNDNRIGYVKVNKKSLEKRLGISSQVMNKEIQEFQNLNVTRFVQHKILKKQWNEFISKNEKTFQEAPEELRNDYDFIRPFLKENGLLLEHTTDQAKKDWKTVLDAVDQNPLALKFSDVEAFARDLASGKPDASNMKAFWADAIFVRAAEQDGMVIEHMPKSVQDNENIVRVAYEQNKESIKFASSRLKKEIND